MIGLLVDRDLSIQVTVQMGWMFSGFKISNVDSQKWTSRRSCRESEA